jgi:hypothetical protein
MKPLPPVDELRRRLELNVEEGELRWRNGSRKAGQLAGYVVDDRGYQAIKIRPYGIFKLHRVIYAMACGQDPGNRQIDHINGCLSDNRPENLRLATPRQQQGNVAKGPDSGIRYTTYKHRPWVARLSTAYLGSYATLEEAQAAYRAAHVARYGEFSVLKEPQDFENGASKHYQNS